MSGLFRGDMQSSPYYNYSLHRLQAGRAFAKADALMTLFHPWILEGLGILLVAVGAAGGIALFISRPLGRTLKRAVGGVCAVMALANAALFSAPPLLLLPQAVEFLYLATDAEFVHLDHRSVAFQPRAPPAS